MERGPHYPEEEQPQRVNSYGTDDPAEQARIEQARVAAFEERQRNRAQLERYVEAGLPPEAAEALIEFSSTSWASSTLRQVSRPRLPRSRIKPSKTWRH